MSVIRHKNSFDILRHLFAISVLFTHSYPILGIPNTDFLSVISKGEYYLPTISVAGFFVISGYLVIQSLQRSRSVKEFLLKRFFRIYPALFVMLLMVVGFGWLVYSGSLWQYLHDRNIYTYFAKNLLMLQKHLIFGFFSGNPVPSIINVSVWSLPYELLLYILVALFFIVPGTKRRGLVFFLYGAFLLGLICTYHQLGLKNKTFDSITTYNLFKYGSFFWGGAVWGLMPATLRKNRKLMLVLSLALLVSILCTSLPFYLLNIALPTFVVSLGILKPAHFAEKILQRTGDISYGIYIYGFPVQQTIEYVLKPGFWVHVALSVAVAGFIGFLSWHLVEKPTMQFLRTYLHKKGLQRL